MVYNIVNMTPLPNNPDLNASLTKILIQLKHLFYSGDFQTTIKHSKRITRLLVYYLKHDQMRNSESSNQLSLMRQCLKIVRWFVNSSQYKKYGHSFAVYAHVLKLFEDFDNRKGYTEQSQSILGRIEKNQSSALYKSTQKEQIEDWEISFSKRSRLTSLIQPLNLDKIIFPNSMCVCCSRAFLRNSGVLNNNKYFNPVLVSPTLDKENLHKLINSITNQNGGVIIIGAKKTIDALKIQGLFYQSLQPRVEAVSMIREVMVKIKPECKFQVQEVPVLNDFYQFENFEPEHIGICFRVIIFPRQPNRLSYLEFTSKNKLQYYETYQLGQDGKPAQVKAQPCKESVYSIIHKKYYQKSKSRINSHENILCFPPIPYIPSNISQIISDKDTNIPITQLSNGFSLNKSHSESLEFRYPRVSLLIVDSTNEDRQVQSFCKYLMEKKHPFEIKKPFPDTFKSKPGDRSVWILCHKLSFVNMRGQLLKAEAKKKVLPVIRTMPVEKTLQIEQSKFLVYNHKIETRFRDRYLQGYFTEKLEIISKKKQKDKLMFLTFSNFEQSIYAFMLMQELNLKPFFTKQGQIYQKK